MKEIGVMLDSLLAEARRTPAIRAQLLQTREEDEPMLALDVYKRQEIHGIPASETTAHVSPARIRERIISPFSRRLCS